VLSWCWFRKHAVNLLLYLLQVATDEIESLYRNHSVDREQLHVFFLLRLALAPVVEAVILLDRLLYLHEQVSHELAFIWPMCLVAVMTGPMAR
jgi:hypothetical protein